jgi:hypothetical protein
VIHAAERPRASLAQTGLAIIAVLALTLSFLGLAQPVRADHVAGSTVWLHQDLGDGVSGENPGEFAGSDEECANVPEGTVRFHFVANQLADGTTVTGSSLTAEFDQGSKTVDGYSPSGDETPSTIHFDVDLTGDETDWVLLDASAHFNIAQTEDTKLVLSHICGAGEDEVEEDLTLVKQDAEGGLIADVGFTLEGGSEMFTDASGQIVFADLTEGEWTLTETTAPEGCEPGGTLTITVDAEGNITVTDDDETDTLVIVSFDAETNTLTLRNDCEGDQEENGFVEIDKLFCDSDEGTRTEIEVNDPIEPGATAQTFDASEDGCEGGVAHFTIYAADEMGNPVGDPVLTTSTDATGTVTFELPAGDYVIVEDSSGESAWFTVEAGMLTIIEVTNFVDDEEENGSVKVLKHNCTGDDDAVLFSIAGSPVSGFDPDTCVDGTGEFQIDDGDSFTVMGEAVVTASVGSHTLSELSPMTGTSPSFEVELDAITTIHVFNVTGEETAGGGEQPVGNGGNGGNGGDDVEGGVRGGQGGPGGLPDTATQETGGFPAGVLALLVLAGLGGFGAVNMQSVRRRLG